MAFDAAQMVFPVHIPDPELLGTLTAGSSMQTPEKVRQVMGELVLPLPPADRPYLYGCMVLSFDGKMGFYDNPEGTLISKENRFDPIGGKTDFWIMNVCRTYADAVILGTGTLRARMNKLWYAEISDGDLVQARAGLGKATAQPLNLVVSLDGTDVPVDHPIFHQLTPKPMILTCRQGAEYLQSAMGQPTALVTQPQDLAAGADVIQILAVGDGCPDTAGLLKLLRESGLSYVSVEAPGYIWQLIREGLLDEYILNYSGVMAGGPNAVGVGAGFTAQAHPHVALLSVGYSRGFLFTRQKLIYDETPAG